MDFEVIKSYIPLFAEAFLLTIKTGWFGIALSFALGLICAFILYFKIPVLSAAVKVYVELFRNTPLLVQLFFMYYGLPILGIRVSTEICGIIGLGLLGGSYMTERNDEATAFQAGDTAPGFCHECAGHSCKHYFSA